MQFRRRNHYMFGASDRITLAEAGIDKYLAHQARKFAALTEEKFEVLIGHAEAAVAVMAGDKAVIKAIRLEEQARKKEARAILVSFSRQISFFS